MNLKIIETFNQADKANDDSTLSKTKIKKKMLKLQKLGQALVCFPTSKIDLLQLPESLLDAIILAKKISSREGNRRQIQFIGKLMRNLDEETINKIHSFLLNSK